MTVIAAKIVVKSGDTNQDAARSTIGAAIDALPNELLALIFTMGATFEPEWMPLSFMTWHFALAVSSISRHWRDVAISSPQLWSHLSFTTDTSRDPRVLFANVFLPRSGAHPLAITVCPEIAGSMRPVLKFILPHYARWRTFCVRPRDGVDLKLILLHTRDISAPLLQHVEILCQSRYYEGNTKHISHASSFIPGTPALSSVRLRAPCVKCGPPLANLTSLEFDSAFSMVTLTQSELESIAAASPVLRELRLRLKHFERTGGTITMPSLRDLSLFFRGRRYGPVNTSIHLLAIINAPALECLELISLQDRDIAALQTYCQDTSNRLHPHTLKLFYTTPLANSYNALFRFFPAITSLYINGSSKFEKPALSLLPALRCLTYNYTHGHSRSLARSHDCVGWICGHVQDRHGTPHAMQSVRIGYSARQNRREEDYQRLRGLVDLVELADEDGSLQEFWSSDEESSDEQTESEDEDDGSEGGNGGDGCWDEGWVDI